MLSFVRVLIWRIINSLKYLDKRIIVSSEKNFLLYEFKQLECSYPPLRLSVLKNVKFSQLKCLILNQNNILSIENLPEIEMPELEYLDLSGNTITNIKSFRKCNYPKLDYLIISIWILTKVARIWEPR